MANLKTNWTYILSGNMSGSLGNARWSRSGIGKVFVVLVIIVIVVAVGGVAVYFLYLNPSTSGGIGSSSIQLAKTSGTVAAGSSMSLSYTVNLASGTKWGTSLQVANADTLASDGITATTSTGAMDPPYSGTLSVTASSTASPGTYQIVLKATGDDPSATNAVFVLTVAPASGTSSTTTSSTTIATSSSSYTNGY
jgi:hypothetical protein